LTAIDGRLDAIVDEAGLPGVAVVAVGPRGVTEAARGLADLATGEPLTSAHRFRIGSVTKLFVATLVLQLVAEGRLELDQTAAPFVDDVTIRQLLNHTSGLDDFVGDLVSFFEPYRRDPSRRWELGPWDELQLVLERPRLFPPGEGWAYHGSNYIALRLVIEETTGLGLRDALHERIFRPLRLENTDLVEGPLRGACARGYLPADNSLLPADPGPLDVTEIDVPFHRAGGGIVSTAGEVATLLRAQLRGDFLPDELRREMLDAVDSDWAETDRYGLGIGEISALMGRQRSTCGPAWGHVGFSVGYLAVAVSSRDGERQVVLCANGHPTTLAAEALWDGAGKLLWDLYCGIV
jgi:D-alanyl-D-alanine carboxypeptidase